MHHCNVCAEACFAKLVGAYQFATRGFGVASNNPAIRQPTRASHTGYSLYSPLIWVLLTRVFVSVAYLEWTGSCANFQGYGSYSVDVANFAPVIFDVFNVGVLKIFEVKVEVCAVNFGGNGIDLQLVGWQVLKLKFIALEL
jgi:hypothetical protein